MTARDIYQLLSNQGSGAALRETIAPAMPDYRGWLAERGRSSPIAIDCDGSLLVIAASHLANLCEAFLQEQLDTAELGYIATALDLAPDFRFVSKEVEECAFLLSAPEANGPPSKEAVTAILRHLREHAA